ncbi:PstC family ABC transporter permease [Nannocystaceae bacterium ST9]
MNDTSARGREHAIEGALLACGLVSLALTLGTLGLLGEQTLAALGEPAGLGGLEIGGLLAGTCLTSLIAIVVALPLGLLAAIHLAEFASASALRVLRPTLDILSAIPTIVFAWLALLVLTPALQRVVPGLADHNALAPGIAMGLMLVPMIASLGEDAIRAVPLGLRDAARGLGAGELATIVHVVLPAASSGLVAIFGLAISRVFGETLIVALAAGREPHASADPRVAIETMSAYLVEVGQRGASPGTLEYRTLFVVAAGLFALTSVIHLVARRLARRLREGE